MFFNKKKQFIIRESKDSSNARFFVSYHLNSSSRNHKKDTQQKSYQLISLLKQQNDVLLEIDSQVTTIASLKETESAFLSLLKDLTDMGIDFRLQKSEAKSNKNLFGMFNPNKTVTAQRILAYIPDKIWREDQFQIILPKFGVRYYICKEQADAKKLLADLHCGRIAEDEKTELFHFVIYDSCDFGQMGINTNLSKEDLQKRLTV